MSSLPHRGVAGLPIPQPAPMVTPPPQPGGPQNEEYHTAKGCLTLTGLVLALSAITIVVILIFGGPSV